MQTSRIPIRDFSNYIDKEIYFSGWVKHIRDLKKIQFLILRDETGAAQIVNEKAGSEMDNIISSLGEDFIVGGKGTIIKNNHVKLGGLEVLLKDMHIISKPVENSPINKESSLNLRLDYRFLDLRNPEKYLIFQIQTDLEQAMREYWIKNNFIEIHSPKFMASASESGAELFSVDYFGRKAYLAQSPQFYKQMAMAAGFGRVFEIGPIFRANPSHTNRHDTEFTGIDVEMSWINSHHEIMDFEQEWLNYVLTKIEEKYRERLKETFGRELIVPKLPFPRITMEEALRLLKESGYSSSKEEDLDSEGERLLAKIIKNKYDHEFVFVTDYPVSIRPFYHMRREDNSGLTKSFDLIWNGLEVTTGAQREHRYWTLIDQVKEKAMDVEGISHYLDFFKYGIPPHGGFGFGLTRALMNITGVPNVKEVTYVYRGPNRLTP